MKTKLIPLEESCKLANVYRWRTRQGEYLLPAEMATKHIYSCVLMIFNHTVPEEDRLEPYKRYTLIMTMDKRRESIRHLLAELAKRKDLTGYMYDDLEHMLVVFRRFDHKKDLAQ